MRKAARIAAIATSLAIVGVAGAALWSWPRTLELSMPVVAPGDPVDAWLAASEALVDGGPGLVRGTEKRVRWFADDAGAQTDFAIVYLHGFSATRQEIAPVCELLADALGANLFETRLSGHGLQSAPLEQVTAEDWLRDAAEALAVGERIGRRLIVVGTSTGATLALAAAAARPDAQLAALVLVSPNFAPKDPSAQWLTAPGGPLLGRLVAGPVHSWIPANDLQARYWSTRYPLDAIVEMMRLVHAVEASLPLEVDAPLLTVLSPDDDVIDIARARAGLSRIRAPARELVEFASGGPSSHVLAGNILAPANNAPLSGHILDFLARHVAGGTPRPQL